MLPLVRAKPLILNMSPWPARSRLAFMPALWHLPFSIFEFRFSRFSAIDPARRSRFDSLERRTYGSFG